MVSHERQLKKEKDNFFTAKEKQKPPKEINSKKVIYRRQSTAEGNSFRHLFERQNNRLFLVLKIVFTSVSLCLLRGEIVFDLPLS